MKNQIKDIVANICDNINKKLEEAIQNNFTIPPEWLYTIETVKMMLPPMSYHIADDKTDLSIEVVTYKGGAGELFYNHDTKQVNYTESNIRTGKYFSTNWLHGENLTMFLKTRILGE